MAESEAVGDLRPHEDPWPDLPFAEEAAALAERYEGTWPHDRKARVLQVALLKAYGEGYTAAGRRERGPDGS